MNALNKVSLQPRASAISHKPIHIDTDKVSAKKAMNDAVRPPPSPYKTKEFRRVKNLKAQSFS